MTDSSKAKDAIVQDLEKLSSERRRHFLPALLLATVVVFGSFVIMGVRPDLLEQPPWQLAVQILLWVLCLLMFPAIGLGLWFPGRAARVGLATAGVVLTVVATTGWPFMLDPSGTAGHQCAAVLGASGMVLLGVGFLSGAFIQRRRISAVYWVATGLTLCALNVVTWMCPATGLWHIVPSHLGGAVALMALAIVVGTASHRHRAVR